MQYGKLIGGELVIAQKNYSSESGETFYNFTANEDIMRENGFLPVISELPDYDACYYQLTESYYASDSQIEIKYTVNPKFIEEARSQKLGYLHYYDMSDAVNSFQFGKQTDWFDRDLRTSLNTSVNSALFLGETEISFLVGDTVIALPIFQAQVLLAKLQQYADSCYMVTANHRGAILNLLTVEEIIDYDFTIGYPEKIVIE